MCHLSLAVEIVNQLIPDQKTFSCKESSIEDIVFFCRVVVVDVDILGLSL